MNIDTLIDGILASYDTYGGVNGTESENFPNRENVVSVLHNIQSLIFPGFRVAENINPQNIRFITGTRVNTIIALLTQEIQKALMYTAMNERSPTQSVRGIVRSHTVSQSSTSPYFDARIEECALHTHQKGCVDNIADSHCFKLAEDTAVALIEVIPEIRRKIQLDATAILHNDPAVKSIEEVILSYPGLEAILVYRIAHFLYSNGIPVIPRIMSEHVHGKTGIDIHPGATIGESFFIDHGTGIVIGETCIIGNNVKLYQGVTLGALSVKKELMNKKRHPTIEDDVTIYANATILGGNTVIGHGSTIGGNTWITTSVLPESAINIKNSVYEQ